MKELEMHNGEVVDANPDKPTELEPGEYRCINCNQIHHVNDGDCPN